MLEPTFPVASNLAAVLGAFAVLLGLFHALLVYWRPLSKQAWKAVDYIWLGFGSLGLLGAVAEVRMSTAAAQVELFKERPAWALQSLNSQVAYLSADPGAICRTWIQSEYSPPPEQFARLQQNFSLACQWAKKLSSHIPQELGEEPATIAPSVFPARPDVPPNETSPMLDDFYLKLNEYNDQVRQARQLANMAKRNDFDWVLVIVGPFLLATALALRITKVSGELRLGA